MNHHWRFAPVPVPAGGCAGGRRRGSAASGCRSAAPARVAAARRTGGWRPPRWRRCCGRRSRSAGLRLTFEPSCRPADRRCVRRFRPKCAAPRACRSSASARRRVAGTSKSGRGQLALLEDRRAVLDLDPHRLGRGEHDRPPRRQAPAPALRLPSAPATRSGSARLRPALERAVAQPGEASTTIASSASAPNTSPLGMVRAGSAGSNTSGWIDRAAAAHFGAQLVADFVAVEPDRGRHNSWRSRSSRSAPAACPSRSVRGFRDGAVGMRVWAAISSTEGPWLHARRGAGRPSRRRPVPSRPSISPHRHRLNLPRPLSGRSPCQPPEPVSRADIHAMPLRPVVERLAHVARRLGQQRSTRARTAARRASGPSP